MKKIFTYIYAIFLFASMNIYAQTANTMMVQVDKIGAEIQPTMYGLFFEDINYGADGGLYGELIKNRSFNFPQALMGWKTYGNVDVKNDGPFERNPHYVHLAYAGHDHKHTGLQNEGFFGVPIKKDEEYRFSVWARATDEASKILVELIDFTSLDGNQPFVGQELIIDSKEWKKYQIILKSPVTFAKSTLRIFLRSKNSVDLEHISLFPVNTWNGHENGLRKDLAQALSDISPGVFRFPGGCIVEGTDLETRYNWKNTLGPVENRPLNENRWQYTRANRFFPDYFQSYGLGFYEYFLFSEEIGAEPVPVVNSGLSCQYQNNKPEDHVEVCDLDSYIQDALDLIEFANGDASSQWGKIRADMGHPAPFNLKFIGVGNEQWGEEYVVRLEPFIKAIREAYPDIKIIGGSGPGSEGSQFEYLWPEMKRLKVDLVDEHFYRNEEWFLSQGARYDNYDRNGPKVFAGEYACHGSSNGRNHFNAALLEAAFMTGLERNADIVHMATYAPLLAHTEGWQWRPDMIWFDNLKSVKTASYYVQQLYSKNKGTNVLPLTMNGKPATGADDQKGLFASAAWDETINEIIIKIVNTSDKPAPVKLNINGLKKNEKLINGKLITLQSSHLNAENTLDNPNLIVPTESIIPIDENILELDINAHSFYVYRFNVK